MALRVALVTPFAWSQPHDVNEHVAGLARELRARGDAVTILAPSNRARDLAAGRRALAAGLRDEEVVAVGPAVPISRRSRMGVPVGVRANLVFALATGGVDLELFAPDAKRKTIVLEWRQAERPLLRSLVRELEAQPDWDLVLLRTRPLASRPPLPRALRGRLRVRTALDGTARAEVLRGAAVFVPALAGVARVELEARAAGAAGVSPHGRALRPELAAAEAARLMEDDEFRARRAEEGKVQAASQSLGALADQVTAVYAAVAARRRRPPTSRTPLDNRDWIVVDLHMHTTWSHDCSIEVDDLLEHAESEGLGAIAVTDHNVFGGALDAVERARGHDLIVIPGEEVKTAGQGEVIGLFLREEIPPGLGFAETIEAIRVQGGLVYLPHPFDRLHAIPDAATLHRHLAEIDVFEVYNARLLFEGYNVEALRFARKYNLTAGAGSGDRGDRRDLREVPAKGDHRDQRAR